MVTTRNADMLGVNTDTITINISRRGWRQTAGIPLGLLLLSAAGAGDPRTFMLLIHSS